MYDTGSTAFMIVCAMLVLLMTPGLAFFYGGLSRRKNVVNTMIMSFAVIGIVAVTWTICGWSFAYGGDGSIPFFGGFDQLGFLSGTSDMLAAAADVPEDAVYPDIINFVFQMAFCMITTAIITGSLAGRMKFGAVCAFAAAWTILVYPPLAHMVWGGDGSLIGDTIGALDFAGGDVVHVSSGLTGLVLCLMLGKRKGFGMMSYRPHNVPFVALGATLLWFGWFGFNGGSQFAADGVAGLAVINTVVASGAALVSWMIVERVKVGLCVSPICYFAISVCKAKFGYDDALDAFGCHCVGGIVGGIFTGLFCVPELSWTDFGGLFYTGDFSLLGSQIAGILITVVFVAVCDVVLGLIIKACFKGDLRVSEEEEAQGLDVAAHGESAYPAYIGLD